MGCCCTKDADEVTSWSPDQTKSGSTTSTIVAQPLDSTDVTPGNGVFTLKRNATVTATTTTTSQKTSTENDSSNLE